MPASGSLSPAYCLARCEGRTWWIILEYMLKACPTQTVKAPRGELYTRHVLVADCPHRTKACQVWQAGL